MNKNFFCVIMAGGVGARFWPMSRTDYPKQFIDILGTGQSLLQQTFNRFKTVCPAENVLVVTNENYKSLVLEQLPEIKSSQVLTEPHRRNTAPCIAYANYRIKSMNPNAIVVVSPSDHIVLKEEMFHQVILSAMQAAQENDWLITLGIRPHNPNTGYGYIQYDENIMCAANNQIKKVKVFTEKPELEMAKSFLASGDFLWNAGIFVWSLKSGMEAFKTYLPEIDSLFDAEADKMGTAEEHALIDRIYPICKNISIDYGVMEKAKNVYVLSADMGWSDLGTWGSLYESRPKDKNANAIVGNSVMTYQTQNCIVNMPKDKLVVLQGLNDYIVVEDHEILLVCKKEEEQQIRQIVNDVLLEKGEKYI
ncbi:MAG: mannose-1-phosphate guanylyltransferase [Bacteroidales bacterium]